MLTHSGGQVTQFDNLVPGACFAFANGGRRYLGLKTIYDEVLPPTISFTIIWWDSLILGDKPPSAITVDSIRENPVFEFPGAVLVPSSEPSMIYTDVTGNPAGCILQTHDKIMLVGAAAVDLERVYVVDVATGRIVTDIFRVSEIYRQPYVTIFDWRIVHSVAGEIVTICHGPFRKPLLGIGMQSRTKKFSR